VNAHSILVTLAYLAALGALVIFATRVLGKVGSKAAAGLPGA
jgi:hypothetical protein